MKKPLSLREKRLMAALSDARQTLRQLSDQAGDVPEWNKRGFAYRTCRRLDKVLNKA